jgi:hypothetical protein
MSGSARSVMPMWQMMAACALSMAIPDKTSRDLGSVIKGGLGLLINTAASLVVAVGLKSAAQSAGAGVGFGGPRSRSSNRWPGL